MPRAPKAAPPETVDTKAQSKLADRIAARLQKRFGTESATRLGEGRAKAKGEVTEVIPSGIEIVDQYLWGCGGYPVGRITETYGAEQCGKTTWMYQSIAAAQADGALTVVVDAEQSFDERRCREYGANTDLVVVASPESMDEGFDMVRGTLEDHDASVPLLIVYDSLAAKGIAKANERFAATGLGVSGKKVGKIQPGEVAKVTSQELNKLPSLLVEKRAHLLFMNQIRTNVGVMFGDPTTTPGGNAPKFFATHRVQLIKGKTIKDPVHGNHLGRWITFMATKTRFVEPFRKVRVPLWYTPRRDKSTGSPTFTGPGFDGDAALVEHAKERGLIEGRHTDKVEELELARAAIEARGWDGFDDAKARKTSSDDDTDDSDEVD